MKIKEIVAESDVGDIANLSAKNVGSGYDTVSKLFSPSQWFKGNDVKIDDEPTDQKSKTATSQKSKTVKDKKTTISSTLHLDKEAVAAAAAGKELLPQDAAKIKALATQVSTGKLKPHNIDHMQLYWALKTAYQGKPLSDDQKQLLIAFNQQL